METDTTNDYDRDLLVELHEHVRDLLADLALDEEDDLTEAEVDDVVEAMDQVTQLLLDSLDVHVVAADGEDGRVLLSVRMPLQPG